MSEYGSKIAFISDIYVRNGLNVAEPSLPGKPPQS
jgi:hypothetical protein